MRVAPTNSARRARWRIGVEHRLGQARVEARAAFDQRAHCAVVFTVALSAALAFAGAAPAAEGPTPVSPGAFGRGAEVETRCPTFLWAGVPGASGYELAVFQLSGSDGAEPVLVTRATVPGEARGFTPSAAECLERGRPYAWSVAATTGSAIEELQWSRPYLFEVGAAPSLEEVEQAIATLERYREHQISSEPASAATAGAASEVREPPDTASTLAPLRKREASTPLAADSPLPGALSAPTTGVVRVASAAAPAIGNPSLRVSANVALGASSNLFKNNQVFLWDDVAGNTALGRNALASAEMGASSNTAVGWTALNSTTTGIHNTAIGSLALQNNLVGSQNTASGHLALRYNLIGSDNTAIGSQSLQQSTSGYRNTAVGERAGINITTGSDNIFLGSFGQPGDANTIRIGGSTVGSGALQQNRTFINGIRGITTDLAGAIPVLIDSIGQLGTASSSRTVKQDIQGLGALADRLLELRPVAFRYKQHAARDPDAPLQFGLIAEEVAEVLPELVVFDQEGKPETVKYHLLSSLLLGALQRQHVELELEHAENRRQHNAFQRQRAESQRLHARLDSVEAKVRTVAKRGGARRNRR